LSSSDFLFSPSGLGGLIFSSDMGGSPVQGIQRQVRRYANLMTLLAI
jgi:hypothetical protein